MPADTKQSTIQLSSYPQVCSKSVDYHQVGKATTYLKKSFQWTVEELWNSGLSKMLLLAMLRESSGIALDVVLSAERKYCALDPGLDDDVTLNHQDTLKAHYARYEKKIKKAKDRYMSAVVTVNALSFYISNLIEYCFKIFINLQIAHADTTQKKTLLMSHAIIMQWLLTTVPKTDQTEDDVRNAFLKIAEFSETEKANIAQSLLEIVLREISARYGEHSSLLGFLKMKTEQNPYDGDTDRDHFARFLEYLIWGEFLAKEIVQG